MELTDGEVAELSSKVASVGLPSDVEVDLINKISDRAVSATQVAIPALLALSAIHQHLVVR